MTHKTEKNTLNQKHGQSPRTFWDDLRPGFNVVEIVVGAPDMVAGMEQRGLPLPAAVGNIMNAVAQGLAQSRPDIVIKPYSAQLAYLPDNKVGAVAVFFRRAAGETGPIDWRAEEQKAFFAMMNRAPAQKVTARNITPQHVRWDPGA